MNRALILFTRVPLPGKTKTRLLPLLSPEQCCQLHSAFLRDIGQVCARLRGCRLLVCYAPEGDPAVLRALVPSAERMFRQEGEGLGARMEYALRAALEDGAEGCLLMGTDLPEVTAFHIEEAFRLLERHDAVLGPSGDGGYYLVGLREPSGVLFQGQSYGEGAVLERTLAAARAVGLRCALAPGCADVDTPEDLEGLVRRMKARPSVCPHTRRLLEEWGLLSGAEG